MVHFRIDCTLPFPREQFWLIRDSHSFFDFIVQDGLLKDLRATKPQYDEHGWGTRVQHYCPANVDCPNMLRAVVGDTLFEVSDEQRWNDKERPCHLQFSIKPSFLSGLSRTYGELSLENFSHPDPDIINPANSMSDALSTESENDAHSTDSATDPESSDSSDASDSSDTETSESAEDYIDRLPAEDKSRHILSGETKVSILTVGWFVERAIVHNLRIFYSQYPSTIARFRQKLYRDFADGDETVPIAKVVERFLEKEREREAEPELPLEPVEQEDDDFAELFAEKSLQNIQVDEYTEWEEKLKALDDFPSLTRVDQDLEMLMQPA